MWITHFKPVSGPNVFDPDETVNQLGRSGHESKVWLQNSLIDHLQEAGIRYKSERSGNDQKKAYSTLNPQINYVVMFKDSEKKSRFWSHFYRSLIRTKL